MAHLREASRWRLCSVVLLTSACAHAASSEEPQSPLEFRERVLKSAAESEASFAFSVFMDGYTLVGNTHIALPGTVKMFVPQAWRRHPNLGRGILMLETEQYAFWLYPQDHSSRTQAIDRVIESLAGKRPREFDLIADAHSRAIRYPVWPDAPKVFWNMQWNGQPIGEVSFGKRAGGWEAHALYAVTLLRHNRVIRVECCALRGDYSNPARAIEPDPRQIAWALDRYYTSDPTADLPADQAQRRRTLEISADSQTNVASGRDYAVHFPLTSAAQRPVEIRLRVSRGEIWEVPRRPREPRPPGEWVPVEERDYFVRFSATGPQTLSCYHINVEGECTAWGSLEVNVSEPQ